MRSDVDLAPMRRGARVGPGASASGAGGSGVAVAVFLITIAALFGVSGGALWMLGINYDGVQGAAASKIHPATYLTCLLFGMVAIARANPLSFIGVLVERHPRALALIVITLLQIVVIAAAGRPNLGTAVDTYLAPALFLVCATELGERAIRRAEILIHALMAANGCLGLVEFALGQRFMPYRFEGALLIGETRSSALQGHPLGNATVTGTYLAMLLVGGGPALAGLARLAMIALQSAAMVAFGGRTATLVLVGLAAAQGIRLCARALRGDRFGAPGILRAAVLAPALALAVVTLGAAGFFDAFLGRLLTQDGGSAAARIAMFDLLSRIPLGELIVGPDQSYVDYARRVEGLSAGIENPLVRMLVYQGAILTGLMLAGFALFLAELASRLRRGSWPAILYFLIVILSFESIASKTTVLSKLVILALAMLGRPARHGGRSPTGGDARQPPFANARTDGGALTGSALRGRA